MQKIFLKISLSLAVIVITGCGKQPVPSRSPVPVAKPMIGNCDKPITIMVHGTSGSSNYSWFIPPLHNVIERSFRTPYGFLHYDELPKHYAFGHLAQELHSKDAEQFPLEGFYFYGWSGKLSNSARERAADDLLEMLLQLPGPKTVITHSHGGNVVLNVAKRAEQRGVLLTIDRLILLACPVQDITEQFICSPVFDKVYHFYSPADLLQVADPQGIHVCHGKNWPKTSFFSRREFKNAPHVKQAKIKRNGRTLMHVHYIQPLFFKKLPDLLKLLDSQECLQLPKTKGGAYCIAL